MSFKLAWFWCATMNYYRYYNTFISIYKFFTMINSDPCLLYFLICSSVRLLVLNFVFNCFIKQVMNALASNFFYISISFIHNTDLLSILFIFFVWTQFLPNVSAPILNILHMLKNNIIFYFYAFPLFSLIILLF